MRVYIKNNYQTKLYILYDLWYLCGLFLYKIFMIFFFMKVHNDGYFLKSDNIIYKHEHIL